jgi:hypothetical protein
MFHLDDALAWLLSAPTTAPSVEGAPPHELSRSPIAALVGQAAAAEGLLLYQFEHRVGLPLPARWVASGVEIDEPEWVDGVLAEPKYASFRHDLGVGSFHPSHRAKWTAHELCHGLVGTAYRPGAPPLFHATAGRLAELVPVVLWYFLDEIGLRRCPRHAGPLFRATCDDCERAAAQGPTPVDEEAARRWLTGAVDFVSAELRAARETLRLGRPVPHIHGSLDLCSDGIAYAVAHGPRLNDPATAAWAERFLPEVMGGATSLAALEERAVEVFIGLCTGRLQLRQNQRADWVCQDLASRVLQGADGDARAVGPVWERLVVRDVEGARATYESMADAAGWMHPLDVFAPGYDVPGGGRALDQVQQGLLTVVPMTMQLADDAGLDVVAPFVAADRPAREPLGLRFAAWAPAIVDEAVAGLAAYEAMLRAARADNEALLLGDGVGARWAEGALRWRGDFDPVAWAERVDAGDVEGRSVDGRLVAPAPDEEPTALVIGRDAAGELVLAGVPLDLDDAPLEDADREVVQALRALGLVVPEAHATAPKARGNPTNRRRKGG